MKFLNHNDSDTFFGSYAPALSTVDQMETYWNNKRCDVHLEGFRDLSLHHHSQLLQSLSAKVKVNLNNCFDFVVISGEIRMLEEKLGRITAQSESQKARAWRDELYWRKLQLVFEQLSKWQRIQSCKIVSTMKHEAPQVASLSSYFSRVRRLDSSRD
jgi:hypothetical protein